MGAPKGLDIRSNVFKTRLDFFCEAATAVMAGHYLALFCSGPPGIGKMHFIEEIRKKDFPYLRVEKRKLDAVHFVDILYELRFDNCVIFIDDKQGMLESPAMQDHLLTALDPGLAQRMISDTRNLPPEGKGKGTFPFKAGSSSSRTKISLRTTIVRRGILPISSML
jgi:hypothetical protein